MTYSQKLKDPRWQKRRLEVMSAANFCCEDCGCSTKTLNVHHCYYLPRRQPWEYGRTLICLCEDCHPVRQSYEQQIHMNMAIAMRHMRPEELQIVWANGFEEIDKFLVKRGIKWPEDMIQDVPCVRTEFQSCQVLSP